MYNIYISYLGRPEGDPVRGSAMNLLGVGLHDAEHYEDALSVMEAELSVKRRHGASEEHILRMQGNLASTYAKLGRHEESMSLERDVYSGRLKLFGEEQYETLVAANNYASSLNGLERFEEAKALFRKIIPVAQRILGESSDLTLRMRWIYARALYADPGATLDDLREAVGALEETERIGRRVLGGAHPLTSAFERHSRHARDALAAREGGDVSSVCDGVAAMTPGDA